MRLSWQSTVDSVVSCYGIQGLIQACISDVLGHHSQWYKVSVCWGTMLFLPILVGKARIPKNVSALPTWLYPSVAKTLNSSGINATIICWDKDKALKFSRVIYTCSTTLLNFWSIWVGDMSRLNLKPRPGINIRAYVKHFSNLWCAALGMQSTMNNSILLI